MANLEESKSVLKRLKEALITNPSIELKRIAGGIILFVAVASVAAGINELVKQETGNSEDGNIPQTEQTNIDFLTGAKMAGEESIEKIQNQKIVVDDMGRKRTIEVKNKTLLVDGVEINDIRTNNEKRNEYEGMYPDDGNEYPNCDYIVLKVLNIKKGLIEVQLKDIIDNRVSSEEWYFEKGVLTRYVGDPSWTEIYLTD